MYGLEIAVNETIPGYSSAPLYGELWAGLRKQKKHFLVLKYCTHRAYAMSMQVDRTLLEGEDRPELLRKQATRHQGTGDLKGPASFGPMLIALNTRLDGLALVSLPQASHYFPSY